MSNVAAPRLNVACSRRRVGNAKPLGLEPRPWRGREAVRVAPNNAARERDSRFDSGLGAFDTEEEEKEESCQKHQEQGRSE